MRMKFFGDGEDGYRLFGEYLTLQPQIMFDYTQIQPRLVGEL